jgi:hypothetical protein
MRTKTCCIVIMLSNLLLNSNPMCVCPPALPPYYDNVHQDKQVGVSCQKPCISIVARHVIKTPAAALPCTFPLYIIDALGHATAIRQQTAADLLPSTTPRPTAAAFPVQAALAVLSHLHLLVKAQPVQDGCCTCLCGVTVKGIKALIHVSLQQTAHSQHSAEPASSLTPQSHLQASICA